MAFKRREDVYVGREIEMMMTQPSNNGSDEQPEVVIRITDRKSSAQFLVITLSAVEFTQLLGSRHIIVKAEMLRNLSRLGRRMEVGDTRLPLTNPATERGWTDAEIAAEAERFRLAGNWETVEHGRIGGGGGIRITGRRWVELKQEGGE